MFSEFLKAQIFFEMGPWQSIVFRGAVNPKLFRFAVTGAEGEKSLYLATVISQAEKMTWQSFEDLFAHSIRFAAASMQGIYGLDVLSLDIQEGVRRFHVQDFATLLMNHARTLAFGERKLVKYGQIYSILHKRAPADFGKIEATTHVELVNPEKTGFVSFLKKTVNAASEEAGAVYLVHDLGGRPAWDPEKETEDPKFSDLLQKNQASEFYYRSETVNHSFSAKEANL